MERLVHEVRMPDDPLGAIHRHQVRHGPYPMRLIGAGIALGALTPAIWLPDVLDGAGTVGTVAAAVVGLLFLGLAANGAMLYRLARGYPPLDLPPLSPIRQRAELRRLQVLTVVPGALVVRALRPWHRSGPADPDVSKNSGGRWATWTSSSGATVSGPRPDPTGAPRATRA